MPKLPIAGDEEQGVLTEPPFLPGLPEFAVYAARASELPHALDELAEPISDVEEDGKGLPILLKQYAKVGGI
jgi:hypothetical protein